VNAIRQAVSEQCRKRAEDPQGIYTLTVPTGGGKTFASMRYALHHAKAHQLDRIIYIIPFTSIIEQNADEIRKVIEQPDDERPWVLEHHSSLEPEKRSKRMELATENWG
jgi:CRISPR-associated endonuclease/helicase Cas3